MGFYDRWLLPQVIELTMRQKNFAPFRERTAGTKSVIDRRAAPAHRAGAAIFRLCSWAGGYNLQRAAPARLRGSEVCDRREASLASRPRMRPDSR
jgi:hypothetical protein